MVWLVLVLGAALIIGGALALSYISDIKWRLRSAEHDAAFWEREAKRMGWKNPFEELAESLRQSTELLKAAAERLREAGAQQDANTEKLRALNRTMRETAERMKAPNAALKAAADRLDAARSALPGSRAPIALLPPAAVPQRTELPRPAGDPQVQAAIRRIENDAAAGRVETDPKKLN